MANWNENKPNPNDIPDETLASLLTTQKQAFREGIEKNLFWTDSSGLSAGQPRFSHGSFGPGAGRAFFGPESQLSSNASAIKPLNGRLFITSDDSHLYAFTNGHTPLLGGVHATVYSDSTSLTKTSMDTIPSNTRFVTLQGIGSLDAATAGGSRQTVAFSDIVGSLFTYHTAPKVQVTGGSRQTNQMAHIAVVASNTTNFAVIATTIWGGSFSGITYCWRSTGTATLL